MGLKCGIYPILYYLHYDNLSLVQWAISNAKMNCVFITLSVPFKPRSSWTPGSFLYIPAPQSVLKAKDVYLRC